MNQLTEWLVRPLTEDINIPVEIGDTILMGRFKNKRVKVKSIDYNEKGDLLIKRPNSNSEYLNQIKNYYHQKKAGKIRYHLIRWKGVEDENPIKKELKENKIIKCSK